MSLLTDYQSYLHQKGYTKSTIRNYGYGVAQFTEWTISQGVSMYDTRYQDLLIFVRYCRKQGQSHARTRTHIMALKLLFAMLIQQGHIRHNPARQVHLKSRGRRLPRDLLEYQVVQRLYEDYPESGPEKLILGLLTFQALRREEVALLRVRHLRLKEGTLSVPETRIGNARRLPLMPEQIVAFYEWSAQKQPEDFLISSSLGTQNLTPRCDRLYRELRTVNPAFRNGHQIRQSVIAHWLKSHDVRVVQYMAGHKWVSSTERYQQSNLHQLQEQLQKHHPLR